VLYITTRIKFDAFTPIHTQEKDRGPEGGLYLPYRMPKWTAEEIAAWKDMTVGQTIASVLNRFFRKKLTSWDVEFCIGRYPIKMVNMGQKIMIAQCWRSLDGSYAKMEQGLASLLMNTPAETVAVTSWVRIAVRIAMLAAIYGELQRQGLAEALDISAPDGDFTQIMALCYAKRMGFPVGKIICSCHTNRNVWDLLKSGQLRTAPGVLAELERYIFDRLGKVETQRYVSCVEEGKMYIIDPAQQQQLQDGIFCSVVSQERMLAAIPNVYTTHSYVLEPDSAVAYSGILDYRAQFGESRTALVLEDRSPLASADTVSQALNISTFQLTALLRK